MQLVTKHHNLGFNKSMSAGGEASWTAYFLQESMRYHKWEHEYCNHS